MAGFFIAGFFMAGFLDGAHAKCPNCGEEDFAGPPEPQIDDLLLCRACNGRFTLEEAIAAGLEQALVKEFAKDGSFKR